MGEVSSKTRLVGKDENTKLSKSKIKIKKQSNYKYVI